MRVSEIYRSIQGESTYAGLPCTFIRTAGCSLRCTYCDTGYALSFQSGTEMTLDDIMVQTRKLGLDLVELTGGEPLVQREITELCRKLLDAGATVLVETSGAFPIDILPEAAVKIVDIKTPSSGMMERNDWNNLAKLSASDEVKFVIASREDFEWSTAICRDYRLFGKRTLLFSPAFPNLPPVTLAEWIIQDKIPVRLQLQLHKYIWPLERRGV